MSLNDLAVKVLLLTFSFVDLHPLESCSNFWQISEPDLLLRKVPSKISLYLMYIK